jgi:hypothetical protein
MFLFWITNLTEIDAYSVPQLEVVTACHPPNRQTAVPMNIIFWRGGAKVVGSECTPGEIDPLVDAMIVNLSSLSFHVKIRYTDSF